MVAYQDLLYNAANDLGVDYIIRGVRNMNDFAYEENLARINKKLGNIETIFLLADDKYSHISSSLVRELIKFNKPVKEFLP